MKTPDIGLLVLRLKDGAWTEDWVCQVRISHGEDDELCVLVWGSGGRKWDRHRPGEDTWKLKGAL